METKLTEKNKPLLLGAGIALLLLFLFRKKGKDEEESNLLNQESQSAGNTTYPASQFFAWANSLEQAMFDWGTDEETIFSIFSQLRNNADFLALKKAFGVRDYTGGITPYIPLISPQLSLDGWLEEELSDSDKQELNSILQSKGITYRI